MALELCDFERRAREAVQHFWQARDNAATEQALRGRSDQGTRSSVTAGKHMDGFADLFIDLAKANGLSEANIHIGGKLLTLPGHFRPSKTWDLILMNGERLVAALEFKSQVGSLGNNANNRAEEVIGLAVDLWKAYRQGAFGKGTPQPFVGYLFLLEDSERARRAGRQLKLHFPIDPAFDRASYADRYDLLCRRMVQEKLYTAAAVILSGREAIDSGEYTEMNEGSGLLNFVTSFAGRVAAEAARGKP